MAEQGEVRTVALVVRLTPSEREGWHAAARAAGWGRTASWVREVVTERVVGSPSSRSATGADSEVARVRAELARIGNNLNQIAYQANTGGIGGPRVEYAGVVRELAGVRRELAAVRDALRDRATPPPRTEPAPAPAREVSPEQEGRERMEQIRVKITALQAQQAAREWRGRGRS